MKRLLGQLVMAMLGLWLAYTLFAGMAREAGASWGEPRYDPVAAAREQARIEALARQAESEAYWGPIRDTAWNVAVILVTLTGSLAGSAWLALLVYRAWERRGLVRADGAGRLPVVLSDLGHMAGRTLDAFHATRLAEASRPAVPHTYSPHYSHRGEVGHSPPVVLPGDAAPALPGLTDLASLGFQPTRDAILLGLGEGGERVTVPAQALCHVALVGATGGGKSNLLRLLLPQLQAIGARVCLADPHHAPYDPESGDDWRPIVQRLHRPPAVTPGEIRDLIAELTDELDRRLELRRMGQRWGAPLFLALDELPVIADTVPGAVDHLGRLLREGRKVSLYSVGASQSMLVKVIGGDSSAREAYRTAFYVGGDLRSASVLLDMPQRELAEGALTTGVAYLRSKATSPARLVRVPLASNGAVRGLLGAGEVDVDPTSFLPEVGTPYAPARSRIDVGREAGYEVDDSASVSPKALRAMVMFRSGLSVSEIAVRMDLTKSTSGSTAQKANAQVQAWLREAIQAEQQYQ